MESTGEALERRGSPQLLVHCCLSFSAIATCRLHVNRRSVPDPAHFSGGSARGRAEQVFRLPFLETQSFLSKADCWHGVIRRVAQIIMPHSRHTRGLEYRSELLREIISIDWLSQLRSED
jgi:hypothetical protein